MEPRDENFFWDQYDGDLNYIRVHTSNKQVHMSNMRVHTSNIRVHTSNKRVHTTTYEYIQTHTVICRSFTKASFNYIPIHRTNIRWHSAVRTYTRTTDMPQCHIYAVFHTIAKQPTHKPDMMQCCAFN